MCIRERSEVARTPEGEATIHHVRTQSGLRAMVLGEASKLPPVVLVHGFAQNGYFWHTPKRSFAIDLAKRGRKVVVIHLRGQLNAHESAPSTFEHHAEDLISTVRELGEVDLVGHSMGGMLAHRAAWASPKRVRRLVTIGTPYKFGRGSKRLQILSSAARLLALTRTVPSGTELPTVRFGEHLRKRAAAYNQRFLPIPIRPWVPGSIEPDVLDAYLRIAFSRSTTGVGRDIVVESPGMGLVHQDLKLGSTPLLIIAGSKDELAPPSSIRWGFDRARRPQKRFLVFRHGHADLIVGKRAPSTVWPAVARFLEEP